MANTYAWLITFLIYDNVWYDKKHKNEPGYISLECQKNALYAAINSLGLHEKVKVVFIEAKIDLPNNILEIWMRTKTANAEIQTRSFPNLEVTPLAMSNTDSLTDILKPVIESNSADRNIVITVGHGSIFGINLYSEKKDTDSDSKVKDSFIELASQKVRSALTVDFLEKCERNKALAEYLTPKLVGRINIGFQLNNLSNKINKSDNKNFEVYVEELNLTVLTVNEIDAAFKSVFLDKPVDILVFDNCLMQNIFTQFELRKTVNFLVAAQSGISYPGFNYAGIIEKICNDITINPQTVANKFVSEDMIRAHTDYDAFENDIQKRWCLNSVQLDQTKYDDIQQHFIAFFKLLDTLITNPDKKISREIYQVVRTTNDQLFGYNIHSLPIIKVIDLNVFLIFFKVRINANNILVNFKEQLLLMADNLTTALNKISVESFIGNQFYPEDNYYKDEDNQQSIGFGFLLPVRRTKDNLVDTLFDKKGDVPYSPEFLKHSDYFNFFEHFWKKSPPR